MGMMMSGLGIFVALIFYAVFLGLCIFVTYLIIKLAIKKAIKELIAEKVAIGSITEKLTDDNFRQYHID